MKRCKVHIKVFAVSETSSIFMLYYFRRGESFKSRWCVAKEDVVTSTTQQNWWNLMLVRTRLVGYFRPHVENFGKFAKQFLISSKCYISRFKHTINYSNILQSNSTSSLRKTGNSNNRTTYSSLLGSWSIDCPTSTCRLSSVYLSYRYTCDFYQIQKRVTRQFGYGGRTLVGAERKYHGLQTRSFSFKIGSLWPL